MPTYEYRCEACGHTFDVVQGFAESPLTTCNVCGGALRKVYAPVGIVFKGSGFYKTDSRASGSKRSSASGAKDPSSGDSAPKEPAAAESKPASPPASTEPASRGAAKAPTSAKPAGD
jgi:putative FmdB family regulatory protein